MRKRRLRLPKIYITGVLVSIVILFVIAAGLFLFKMYRISQIDSFEKCAKMFPVMETYPAQCRANGKTFVEPIY